MPQMPGGFMNAYPDVDTWIEKIHTLVQRRDKRIVLFGFSLGARAVLLYLEKYNTLVEHVILISTPGNVVEMLRVKQGRGKAFFQHVIDMEQIRHLSKKWTVIHSHDDPIVGFDYGQDLAEKLHAEFILVDGYGHFAKRKYGEYLFKILQDRLYIH